MADNHWKLNAADKEGCRLRQTNALKSVEPLVHKLQFRNTFSSGGIEF